VSRSSGAADFGEHRGRALRQRRDGQDEHVTARR
jgi:hypothetical protein